MHRLIMWGLVLFGILLCTTESEAQPVGEMTRLGAEGAGFEEAMFTLWLLRTTAGSEHPPVVDRILFSPDNVTISEHEAAQRMARRAPLRCGSGVVDQTLVVRCTPLSPDDAEMNQWFIRHGGLYLGSDAPSLAPDVPVMVISGGDFRIVPARVIAAAERLFFIEHDGLSVSARAPVPEEATGAAWVLEFGIARRL